MYGMGGIIWVYMVLGGGGYYWGIYGIEGGGGVIGV